MNLLKINNILPFGVLLMLLAGCPSLLWANNDPMNMPAPSVKKLETAFYLDVVRAGDRVVAVGDMGLISYSDDNGKSWQQASVPTSLTLTAAYFVDNKNGWAVGHDGILLQTTDGGVSWQKLHDGNYFNEITLEAVTRIVADFEAELAEATEEEREQMELEHENLGYQLDDARYAVEDGPIKPFIDLWFANPREGLLLGTFGMLFRTEDGGKSWMALNGVIDNPENFHYYGITRTKDALLIAGETGILYRSLDQGRSWESLVSPYEGSLFGIVGDPAGDTALAVGLRGNLVEMIGNGETLTHLVSPVPASLNTGVLQKDGSWFLVGLGSQGLRQGSGQSALVPVKTGFPGCLSVIETADEHLVLAGLGGLMRFNPKVEQ